MDEPSSNKLTLWNLCGADMQHTLIAALADASLFCTGTVIPGILSTHQCFLISVTIFSESFMMFSDSLPLLHHVLCLCCRSVCLPRTF